ncbi:ATP-binding protein [Aquabacterium sp.]|uniref:ATP-binding protein n=1 Tax=Aquabacterium sp. TaxID=1872578 RepID=UPI002C949A65|nr:ATP-binding protein [Aquabacterium sp.]HSW05563.1 ATP-binding protein [Aquabacterium sp.]
MSASQSTRQNAEHQLQQELLRLSLHNAVRTVPMQLLASFYLLYLSLRVAEPWVSLLIGVLGPVVGLWRWQIARRYAGQAHVPPGDLRRARSAMEINAALAGLLWSIALVMVYPELRGIEATVMLIIVSGSVATAALFMSLAGRSYLMLVAPQMGTLMVVSLVLEPVRSVPLAVLAVIFGVTLHRASREYSEITERAIRHRLEVDEANASLQLAKEAAEAGSRAKTEFLAMMSHEIRTPMNGVLGALDLLRRSGLDARQRRLARVAASSGGSLMTILNDVLDQSKIEAGKFTLSQSPMSLHALLLSVVTLFRANAEARGLRLELELGASVADRVIGDAQRLKQVLSNLIGNAIKFTEHGHISLQVTQRAEGVRFEVRDSGIGIPADRLDRLFDPFYQIDTSRRRSRGGTGLGLSISQRIVEAMGGRIEVQSTAGRGSVFGFTLRLAADPAPAPLAPGDSAMGALDGEAVLQGTVLLAEDNPVNRMIAVEMLLSIGLQVLEADNGLSAAEIVERQPVDAVLMDCQMPLLDGYEATRRIREHEARLGLPRTPILALTADAFADDADRARDAGMDARLTKPFSQSQLRELLEAWL